MLEKSVAAFLDEVAARQPAPGGGASCAIVVAMAAGLVGMTARYSSGLEEADEIARQADELRDRAGPLAQADADAYGAFLAARRLPEGDPDRDRAVRDAEERAAAVPLEIAETAAAVVQLADVVAEKGNPRLHGDAFAAATLARAAARAAANLVLVNLGGREDHRVRRARELASL